MGLGAQHSDLCMRQTQAGHLLKLGTTWWQVGAVRASVPFVIVCDGHGYVNLLNNLLTYADVC